MSLFDSVPTEEVYAVTPAHNSVAQEQADQAARQQAQANNAGGNARSQHRLTTHGVGNSKAVVPLTFAVTFVDQPLLTTGVVMLSNGLDFGALPLVTVGVYRWTRDSRGLYVGAHLWVAVGLARDVVDYQALNATTNGYRLEHHLSFEGLAIRDVSYDAITDDF